MPNVASAEIGYDPFFVAHQTPSRPWGQGGSSSAGGSASYPVRVSLSVVGIEEPDVRSMACPDRSCLSWSSRAW